MGYLLFAITNVCFGEKTMVKKKVLVVITPFLLKNPFGGITRVTPFFVQADENYGLQ